MMVLSRIVRAVRLWRKPMSTESKVTPGIANLIKQRHGEVYRNEQARYQCAKEYRRLHYWLGIPTVIITAAISSSLFYLLENNATQYQKFILASISAIAAVLVSVQTFLEPSKLAEKNVDCGRGLYGLRMKLEHFVAKLDSVQNEEAEEFLKQTSSEMEKVSAGVPEIPTRIWKKYCETEAPPY